nr:MAG TPA: hypothetical protein [Caudoviricetes sp.]
MGVLPSCHPPTPPPTGVGLQSDAPALARGRVDASLKKNISPYLHTFSILKKNISPYLHIPLSH